MKTAAAAGGTRRQRAAEGALAEPALWALVGNTPLIRLPPVAAHSRPLPPLFLKAEWLNPGGSVKDRAALSILRDGIARGELPAKRVLDSSSGNTAIALRTRSRARTVRSARLVTSPRLSRTGTGMPISTTTRRMPEPIT